MPKVAKCEGAKLNEFQKSQLLKEVLTAYPNLKMMQGDLEWLITQYSEADKNIAKKLLEKVQKGVYVPDVSSQDNANEGVIKTYSPNDPEYQEILAKMEKSKESWNQYQKEIEEKAIQEMAQKNTSLVSITEDV